MQYSVLIPVFARDVLHGGPRAYGFLLAAQGVGAVAGRSTCWPHPVIAAWVCAITSFSACSAPAAGIFIFGFSSVMCAVAGWRRC